MQQLHCIYIYIYLEKFVKIYEGGLKLLRKTKKDELTKNNLNLLHLPNAQVT